MGYNLESGAGGAAPGPSWGNATERALNIRLASASDLPTLQTLMADAIEILQRAFLSADQIAASRTLMGLDTQLIEDGTYYIVHHGDRPAGCGGWSRRNTLYGGDHSPGRDASPLDPACDAARIRAMYTAPACARRGVGRLILSVCEAAASAQGFTRVQLAATLAGEPFYLACGYSVVERTQDARGGVPVPLLRMAKILPSGAG